MKSILKNLIKDANLFHANKSCISPYAIRNMLHFQCFMHFPQMIYNNRTHSMFRKTMNDVLKWV